MNNYCEKIDRELIEEVKQCEEMNEYKYRLLFEYRDIIEKRMKLDKYITENKNRVMDEKQNRNMELMIKQMELLIQYEEVIYTRLRLELTK